MSFLTKTLPIIVKFYSIATIDNNVYKYFDFENRSNKKHISKINNQYTFMKNHNSSKKCASDSIKNKHICYQQKNSVSLAIVGGGSTTFYLAILLKQNPAIKVIHVIDTDNSLIGPIYDIGQIDTSTIVIHYKRNSIIDGLHNVSFIFIFKLIWYIL
jgi:FlaA1/EpsC-like NDP-sugar epimerase